MEASQVRLVVCDLDGTLLRGDMTAHPRTRQAVERIRSVGIRFGIASGRHPVPTRTRFVDWGIDGMVDFFVGMNGGYAVDYDSDRVHRGPQLPPETIHKLVKHFEGFPVALALTENERSVLDRENHLTTMFAELDQQPYVVKDFNAYVTSPVGKLYVVFDPADGRLVLDHAARFADPSVRLVQTHDLLVEFCDATIDKATGLRAFAEAEGITLDEIVAFGDNDNDVEMLSEVGWGVAMADSSEAALAAADELIGSNDSDAIATWLEGVFQLSPQAEVLSELEQVASTVALECGRFVRDERPAELSVAATKTSATDVVTAMDQQSEKLARDLLTRLRPDDGLMGEEGLDIPSATGITWVVDPIDGTVNYLYGNGEYAVSVCAVVGDPRVRGRWWPVAGAIYHPEADELFVAHRGGGARVVRDGREVGLVFDPPATLDRTLVGTGFSYHKHVRAWQGRLVADLLPRVRDIRRHGAAALDLCYVAAGRQDAYYESNTHAWDVAAGWVIAEESGAVVRGLGERSPSERMIVAGSQEIVTELSEIISGYVPD